MPTDAQIRANRRNAQRSTGPRTTEGKQRSSCNAVKHALTARLVVLPWEDIGDYFELHGALLRQYQPEYPSEMFLVDQLAQNWWRLNRSRRFETGMLSKLDPKCESEGVRPEDIDLHRRYEAAIERAYYRAYDRLEKIVRRRDLVAKSEDPRDLTAPPAPETEASTLDSTNGFVSQSDSVAESDGAVMIENTDRNTAAEVDTGACRVEVHGGIDSERPSGIDVELRPDSSSYGRVAVLDTGAEIQKRDLHEIGTVVVEEMMVHGYNAQGGGAVRQR